MYESTINIIKYVMQANLTFRAQLLPLITIFLKSLILIFAMRYFAIYLFSTVIFQWKWNMRVYGFFFNVESEMYILKYRFITIVYKV